MSVKKALAALPLVLNACGGGDGDDTPDYTPNEIGQGIWNGGFSATTINTTSSASGSVSTFEPTAVTGIGLYSSYITRNNYDEKRAFFFKEDDGTLFTNDYPGIVNNILVSGPSIYRSGNTTGSVSINANAYISTSISGSYTGSINGYYVMLFDQKYFRGANLASLAGNWNYTPPSSNAVGDWQFSVNSDGTFTIISTVVTSCTGNGAFFTIGDGSKNEYDVSVLLSDCGAFNGGYRGLAATIDTSVQNDTLIMALYNADHGFFLKPVKN